MSESSVQPLSLIHICILRVGVPNGLENGMFQIGKLLVAGLITTFGTSAIAANAICNNVGSMSNIPGSAIGLAMITVVGQCVAEPLSLIHI